MGAKNENQETCPLCLQRRKRHDCMVCYVCDNKIMKPMAETNAKAIASGRFKDVIDPFDFVITKGQEAIETKKKEREEIGAGLEDHKKDLWTEAERYVAQLLSSAHRGDHAVYLATKINQHGTTVDKFQQLKRDDKLFKSHYALGKVIESLQKLVASLIEKRDQYLAEMNDEAGEEEAAVA